jgi:hypothetical protein
MPHNTPQELKIKRGKYESHEFYKELGKQNQSGATSCATFKELHGS